VTPHLVRAGLVEAPRPLGVDPGVLATMRDALRGVVEDGTGASAHVEGLEVGGKTGTAQVIAQKTWIKSEALKYEHRDHAWFASFASDGERSLVVVVFVEHGGHGSSAAAPLAKRMFETYYARSLEHSGAS
jgi:penicillin-binding protein 2